jgi:hypothetical protein
VTRQPGWEARLASVIEAARAEPYELGTHDCFKVACMGVQALTGVDLWTPWSGSYRTRDQALRRIAEYAVGAPEAYRALDVFDRAFSRLFGSAPVDVRQAHQGDVVKLIDPKGPHLGLCVGSDVAVLGEDGLLFVRLSVCQNCWRI